MMIDVLVAEIGSTTTVVNSFCGIGTKKPIFFGQGHAPTSVLEGDVRIGLKAAIEDLRIKMKLDKISGCRMLASSSAAGGLRMTVHGLVYDMTVRAGKEAALGAGANIHMTTAGVLTELECTELKGIQPNLILLAGGTDYGERDTAVKNAQILAAQTDAPVIYCGNIQNQNIIKQIFADAGKKLYVTENVYPRLDDLNIEPVRVLIHKAFEERITEAPGMEFVRDMVQGRIIPTPGAVMECTKLIYDEMGDALVIDVGGATTDIHSVTDGSEEIALKQTSPEPKAKRTVEGDLGVYINAKSLCEQVGIDKLIQETGVDVEKVLADYKPIPETAEQFTLTGCLAQYAAVFALKRHTGTFKYTYHSGGRRSWAVGKDLTALKYIVATGGALTRLPNRRDIMIKLSSLGDDQSLLYPKQSNLTILEDSNYLMASLGVLSLEYPNDAAIILKENLKESVCIPG